MTTLKMKITDKLIAAMDETITRLSDTETAGFHVRFGKTKPDGSRAAKYYFYYRVGGRGGKEGNYLIGNIGSMTSTEARDKAKELSVRVTNGEDINLSRKQEIKKANETKPKLMTVNDLIDKFVNLKLKTERKRPEIAESMFKNDVRPTIGHLPLDDLKGAKIIEMCLDPIVSRGSPIQANKTLSLLKQVLQYGYERDLIKSNVLSGTQRTSIGGKETSRKRNLNLDEIKQFFNWLRKSSASINVKHALYLMLLTGCRSGELTQSKWENIDFDKREWFFPESIRKGNKGETESHSVYLTDEMISSLKSLQASQSMVNTEFVFPSLGENGHIDNRAISRYLARQFDKEDSNLNMEKFVPHDLRRTFTTQMKAMKIDVIVVEKLLSHKLRDMLAVYDQHDYLDERKAALIKWSMKVEKLLRVKNAKAQTQDN